MKRNNNKLQYFNGLLKATAVLCLLSLFMMKPLIKRELENSKNPIELCEESEENSEENETEIELDVLEGALFSTFMLDELSRMTDRSFDCFISQYENRFIPIINTPPPQFV